MSLQVKTTNFIGKELHYYEEISSTNECAKQLIANSKPSHGAVILADFQLKGKGQAGNVWQSAKGKNLLFSILLKPNQLEVTAQFIWNMMISVALAEGLQQFVNNKVQVKWPNDIVIERRKIAGILIENTLQGTTISHLIAGVGLNVNQLHFAPELTAVSSLAMERGVEFEKIAVLEQLLRNVEYWIAKYEANQIGEIKRAYFSRLYQYQEIATYLVDGSQVSGEIIGVGEHGQLMVNIDGTLQQFANKEIKFL